MEDFNFSIDQPVLDQEPTPAPVPPSGGESGPSIKPDNPDQFERMMTGSIDQLAAPITTRLPSMGSTQFFNADVVDKFAAQKSYQGEGFDPGDYQGNMDRFASRETWGSTLEKSLNDFNYKFAGSFKGNFETYGQIGSALWNMDISKMDLSEDEKIKRYYQDNLNEERNTIFQTQEEDEQFFNKQFVKDLLGNSGFALGTFAAMGLELAADAALEAVTFGGASGVVAADVAGLGAKLLSGARKIGEGMGMAGKTSAEIRAASRTARALEEGLEASVAAGKLGRASSAAGARTLAEINAGLRLDVGELGKASKLYEQAGKLFEHLPVIGTLPKYGSRMLAAAEGGEGALRVAGIGLSGFRRSVIELNMAASEAAFESVTTYGDTLDRLVSQYRESHNGDAPSARELEDMRGYASQASSANYQTNLGLLLVSNKLQFGNLFTKYLPANKLVRDLTEETADQFVRVTGKLAKTGAQGTRLFEKGALGMLGVLPKVATEFGKKEALWQGAKSVLKGAGKFELLEGVQENLQETSAAGWRDYYTNAYSRTPQTLSQAMGAGLREQFTEQGAKTFLMGALTGAIIHGPTTLAQKSLQLAQDKMYTLGGKESPLKNARERTSQDIKTLNAFFLDPGKFVFDPQVLLFNEQVQAATQMTDAAREGKVYEWHNAKEDSLLSIAKAARRLNSMDTLEREIHELGKNFTPEQFQEAFGIDLKDTRYESVDTFAQSVTKDLRSYIDEIDRVKRQVGPWIDPHKFQTGTGKFRGAAMLNASLEQAVEYVALNKIKGGLAAKRAQEVSAKISQIEGLGDMSEWLINSVTNFDKHKAEMGLLSQNIDQTKQNLREMEKSRANQHNEGITYDSKLHDQLLEELDAQEQQYRLMAHWSSFYEEKFENQPGPDGQDRLVTVGAEFIGKKGKTRQSVEKNPGEYEFQEVDAMVLDHPEIAQVFTDLLNAKNRQNKVPFQQRAQPLSQAAVQEGFSHILDYIRLEKDARDYLEAVDKISNPANFIAQYARMSDGAFKAGLGQYLGGLLAQVPMLIIQRLSLHDMSLLEDMMREQQESGKAHPKVTALRDALRNHPSFLNLQTIYLSDKLGIEQADYVAATAQELDKVLEEKMQEILGVGPEPVDVAPTAEPEEQAESEETPEQPVEDLTLEDQAARTEQQLAEAREQLEKINAEMQELERPHVELMILLMQRQEPGDQAEVDEFSAENPDVLPRNEAFANQIIQQSEQMSPEQLSARIEQLRAELSAPLPEEGTEATEVSDPEPQPVPSAPVSSNPFSRVTFGADPGQVPTPTPTPVAPTAPAAPAKSSNPFDRVTYGSEASLPSTPTEPLSTAGQINQVFDDMASSVGQSAYQAAYDRFQKSGEFQVSKAPAIEAMRKDQRYQLRDNPDGTVTVIGMENPNPGPITSEPLPSGEVEVKDQDGMVIATTEPEEAADLVETFNQELANLTLAKTLLGDREDLLGDWLRGAGILLQQKNQSKSQQKKGEIASITDYYTQGGKTALTKLAKELIRGSKPEPVVETPPVVVSTSTLEGEGQVQFVSPALTGIVQLSTEDLSGFAARLDTIWTAHAERSTESGIFVEGSQSTSTESTSVDDVWAQMDEALRCNL